MSNSEILRELNELSKTTFTQLTKVKRAGQCRLIKASDKTFDVYQNVNNGRLIAVMKNGSLISAK